VLEVQIYVTRRRPGVGDEVEDGGRIDGQCGVGAGQREDRLALCRGEGVDVDQRLDVRIAGRRVRDDGTAVRVADQYDGSSFQRS
jgi:hypothetical protein